MIFNNRYIKHFKGSPQILCGGKVRRLFYSIFIFFILLNLSCQPSKTTDHNSIERVIKIIIDWNNLFLNLVKESEGYRPPVSARMYAYMGMGLWQASYPEYTDKVLGLDEIFSGIYTTKWNTKIEFKIEASVNSCYYNLAKDFFPHTTMVLLKQIQDLYDHHKEDGLSQSGESYLESDEYGKLVAEDIFNWSRTDKISHQAYLFNFDPNYRMPPLESNWSSTTQDSMPALLPHWGESRTFTLPVDDIEVHDPILFEKSIESPFYAEAFEVFNLSHPITEEKRWIAEFWSDDFPGVTFCPTSRWISILTQIIRQRSLPYLTVTEAYLRLGLGLNDAAVVTWKAKYKYNLMRPETYIRMLINPKWEPLHHSPSFPAYPSGHSIFGSTSATIFNQLLGPKMDFTDRSHEGAREFIGKPRNFKSFDEMAKENALSRLYLGVHYRMDCEEGLRLGKIVGNKVNQLKIYRN